MTPPASSQSSETFPLTDSGGTPWGQGSTGQVSYHVQPTGDALTINWTWGSPGVLDSTNNCWDSSGFSSTISGNYPPFGTISGTWDGGNVFGGLPATPTPGLVISVFAPLATASYGPPQIEWNGVKLVFDPIASAISATNPQGNDVYKDTLGLGLVATVTPSGAVTLSDAGGDQFTGQYNPSDYQITFPGQSPGSVQANSAQGFALSLGRGTTTTSGTTPTLEEPGNFDIQGNILTFGSWMLSGTSMPGLTLSYIDAPTGSPSLLQFAAGRQSAAWVWSHGDTDGSSTQDLTMQIDPWNRLNLFAPQVTGTTQAPPTLTLDPAPSGASRIPGTVSMPGTVLIKPAGDILMGSYTTGTAPQ